MFLHLQLVQLILYFISTSNAGELGFDTYEWKPAASVSEAQRRHRPDGIAPVDNSNNHIISLARVNLGGHVTAGNFVPSAYEQVYFSWYNNGTPSERHVTDLDKWKVELLVHNLDSLSWVFNRGKLPPGTPGHVHVGKYENGQWAVVCRAVVPNSRRLYVGKYLWTLGNPNLPSSNACLISIHGKEIAIEGFEVLQVNLIGKSTKKGYAIYPGISYEYMVGGASPPPLSETSTTGTKSGNKDVNFKKTKTAQLAD